jgi:hypothetical protein
MVVCTASTLPKEGGRRTVVRSKPRQILGTGTCFFVLCLLLIFSPTPTLSCSGKIDLVFCLDGSGSVNSGNWNLQSDFVKSFVDTFSGNTGDTSCSGLTCGNFDGEKGLKVGIVIYGDDSAVAITLSNDYQAIKQASVNRIETGGTGTGKCLTMAQQMLHDPTKGARGTDAAKILVLMSDGVATDATDGPSKSAKQGGTRLIAIGVATGGAHTDAACSPMKACSGADKALMALVTKTCAVCDKYDLFFFLRRRHYFFWNVFTHHRPITSFSPPFPFFFLLLPVWLYLLVLAATETVRDRARCAHRPPTAPCRAKNVPVGSTFHASPLSAAFPAFSRQSPNRRVPSIAWVSGVLGKRATLRPARRDEVSWSPGPPRMVAVIAPRPPRPGPARSTACTPLDLGCPPRVQHPVRRKRNTFKSHNNPKTMVNFALPTIPGNARRANSLGVNGPLAATMGNKPAHQPLLRRRQTGVVRALARKREPAPPTASFHGVLLARAIK